MIPIDRGMPEHDDPIEPYFERNDGDKASDDYSKNVNFRDTGLLLPLLARDSAIEELAKMRYTDFLNMLLDPAPAR